MASRFRFQLRNMAAAAVCVAGLLVLDGCDQRPYPTPTQDPAPQPPPTELMGAPAPPPANETTAAPTQTPAPAPLKAPDVTMAPIPNPPEPPRSAERADPRPPVAAPSPAAAPAPSAVPAPLAATSVRTAAPLTGQPMVGAPPVVAPATAPPHPVAAQGEPQPEAFQAAAATALNHGSQLKLPARFETGQAAQVTLTLPASFAAALSKAAINGGLTTAGGPIDVTAALTGQGYRIEPMEPQSLPLQAGQPLVFHWTVTPSAGARTALRARVCAAAPAGSEPICIGPVLASKAGFRINSQLLGAALLVVIVGLVIAWLSRDRRAPPSRSPEARRAARQAAMVEPPLPQT